MSARAPRGRYLIDAFDPEGRRHGGLPTYPWRLAPAGLATRRQLAAKNLRPAGQPIAAQVLWRRYGTVRVAYLYRIDLAKPKRRPTHAQWLAIGAALLARQVCPTCGEAVGYYIPRRYGQCLDCADTWRQHVTTPPEISAAA
jgi:hypothetical protein